MMRTGRLALLLAALLLAPLGVSAARHYGEMPAGDWWGADRSSAGLLPDPAAHPQALVRVFAARTVRWRGIFAVHCWIVVKPEGAAGYTRYDYTAWGAPIRVNGFEPDGRWFGRAPEVVFAAGGPDAAAIIPRIQAAVAAYRWRQVGDYRAWPGPNSNTFVAAVMDQAGVPVALPPNAIGKDYPHDGAWLRLAPDGLGLRMSLGGYAGLNLGWVDGVELSILGTALGLDLRRPALKLPGVGRIGMPAAAWGATAS